LSEKLKEKYLRSK